MDSYFRISVSSLAAALVAGLLSAPAAGQPTSGPAPGTSIISRDVAVDHNETLRDLAERELGRRGLASALAEYNGLAVDATLPAGTIVRIPALIRDRPESASIIFVKGDVLVNGEVVDSTALISPGDVIETGPNGFMSLEFSNGSAVNLQPESSATLQQLQCLEEYDNCLIEIETTTGELTSDINRRDGQPLDYRITTPYASAAVRGTVFEISADPENLLVAVTEGEVNIGALGVTVPVEEGFGSVTAEGQPPGPPVALLPAPTFRSVPGRIAPGDAVQWWPLREVDNYSAGIFNDSGQKETIAMLNATGDRLDVATIDGVSAGAYFLGLRGIDPDGIPGFVSSTRVVIADIDPALDAPDVTVAREGNDTLVTVTNPAPDAAGFEIQLSSSEDFIDPLSVDVGPTGTALFRIHSDVIFARARQLENPTTVSAYGAVGALR